LLHTGEAYNIKRRTTCISAFNIFRAYVQCHEVHTGLYGNLLVVTNVLVGSHTWKCWYDTSTTTSYKGT